MSTELSFAIQSLPLLVFVSQCVKNWNQLVIQQLTSPRLQFTENPFEAHVIIQNICEQCFKFENKFHIIVSGETDAPVFKPELLISTTMEVHGHSQFFLYCPQMILSLGERRLSINPRDYANVPKTKFCAFLYHVDYPHRIEYFQLLNQYKTVDGLGQSCNNTNIMSSRHIYNEQLTYNDIAVQYYTSYKFVLAIENQFKKGYLTEKIINPLIANSLPIYYGDPSVFNFFNKKRMIYANDFATQQDLLNHIIYLDQNDDAYNQILSEEIWTTPNIKDLFVNQFSEKLNTILNML